MRGYGAVRGLVSRAHRPFPVVRSHCRAHRPCAVVRSRCGRARCPHRAAAPSARCAAWHPVRTLRVLHAAALSAARCAAGPRIRRDVMIAPPLRPRITRAARAGRPGGQTSRPTAITHARGARNICPRGAPAHDRGALRAAITPAKFVRHAARGGERGLQEKEGNDRMENDSR